MSRCLTYHPYKILAHFQISWSGIYRPCLVMKTSMFVKTSLKRLFSFQLMLRDIGFGRDQIWWKHSGRVFFKFPPKRGLAWSRTKWKLADNDPSFLSALFSWRKRLFSEMSIFSLFSEQKRPVWKSGHRFHRIVDRKLDHKTSTREYH
jgi:hypothetical protein